MKHTNKEILSQPLFLFENRQNSSYRNNGCQRQKHTYVGTRHSGPKEVRAQDTLALVG